MSIFGHTNDVANICINWANQGLDMTWEQWRHGNNSLYDYAYTAGTPRPAINGATRLSCWELPLLALVHGNYVDDGGLRNILASDPMATGIEFLIPSTFNGLQDYQHGVTNPTKGHLVFFDGMAHVAILTGELNDLRNAVVVSFWAHTTHEPLAVSGGPVPNIPVEYNTIEGLQQIIVERGLSAAPPRVQIAKPVWR